MAERIYAARNIDYSVRANYQSDGRGFYDKIQSFTGGSGAPQNRRSAYGHTVGGIIILLNSFLSGAPISPGYITNLRAQFDAFEGYGMKVLPGVAYNFNTSPVDEAPWDASGATGPLKHVDQLAEVFNDYDHLIVTTMASTIGRWGEHHTSNRYLGVNAPGKYSSHVNGGQWFNANGMTIIRKVIADWPGFIHLRYSEGTRAWLETEGGYVNNDGSTWNGRAIPMLAAERFGGSLRARMGAHWDDFVGQSSSALMSDGGTFSYSAHEQSRMWVAEHARGAPVIGECDPNAPYDAYGSDDQVLARQFRRFGWDFFDWDFNSGASNTGRSTSWKTQTNMRMGYNHQIQRSTCQETAAPGGSLILSFLLQNIGWSVFKSHTARPMRVLLRSLDNGHLRTIDVPVSAANNTDVRRWYPTNFDNQHGQRDTASTPDANRYISTPVIHAVTCQVTLPGDLLEHDYEVLLEFPDGSSELKEDNLFNMRATSQHASAVPAPLSIASGADLYESSTGAHRLGHVLAVDAGTDPGPDPDPIFTYSGRSLAVSATVQQTIRLSGRSLPVSVSVEQVQRFSGRSAAVSAQPRRGRFLARPIRR